MLELRQLLSILQSKHLRAESAMDERGRPGDSLMQRLTLNTLAKSYTTNHQAATDLYGQQYDPHTFEVLKSKLKQRALTSLLLLDIGEPTTNPRSAMRHRLLRQLVQVNLLLLFGTRKTAIRLLRKIERLSTSYQLTDLTLECMILLRSHYWYAGQRDQYQRASRRIDQLLALLGKELRAEALYFEASISFVRSKAKNKVIVTNISKLLQELEHLAEGEQSFMLLSYQYKLSILSYQLSDQYQNVIRESKKAMKLFAKERRFYDKATYFFFLLTLCESLQLLRNYEEASQYLAECYTVLERSNPNVLSVQRISLLTNLGMGQIEKAEQIVTAVQATSTPALSQHHQEEWVLMRNYVVAIKAMQMIRKHGRASKEAMQQIKQLPSKLNLPIFSKDKLGVNIPIVILRVLSLVLRRNHKELMQSDKILDNYIYRYLISNKEYIRSAAFLKLLRLAIKEDFNKERVKKKSIKLLTTLHQIRSLESIEILPYDILAELFIESVCE